MLPEKGLLATAGNPDVTEGGRGFPRKRVLSLPSRRILVFQQHSLRAQDLLGD